MTLDIMTAEQAREAAKGLTFETVWAALMESRKNSEEMDRRIEESRRETDKRMEESRRETDKRMEESRQRMDESLSRMEHTVSELSRNVGGLNNSFGAWGEAQFSYKLWEKFDELKYGFTAGGSKTFTKGSHIIAECDVFLENGEYVCAVEIKTTVTEKKINEHLDRLRHIRDYMNDRGDSRKMIGAIAGVVFSAKDQEYALSLGLYVITQSNDNVVITLGDAGWKPKEW